MKTNEMLVLQHKAIVEEMNHIYEKKNHDYGDSFNRSIDRWGLTAALTRMNDKLDRVDALKDKDIKVVDESLRDTLLDLANYAIMTAMYLENMDEEHVEELGTIEDEYHKEFEEYKKRTWLTPTPWTPAPDDTMCKDETEEETK